MPSVKKEEEDDEEEEEFQQPESKKAKKSTARVKKEEDEEDGDDDDEEEAAESESSVKRNADGEAYFELGTKKRCTVRKWNNNVLVDIREVCITTLAMVASCVCVDFIRFLSDTIVHPSLCI